MEKRHFQNCMSKEKKKFESNVKKYKRLLECEGRVKIVHPIKIKPVAIISEHSNSEPVASTSACDLSSSSTSSKNEGSVKILYPIKIKPVAIISEHSNSEPVASTSACDLSSSSTSSSSKNDAKNEGCVEIEYPIKLEPVSIISEHFKSEPEASTSACGLFSSSTSSSSTNDAKNKGCVEIVNPIKLEPVPIMTEYFNSEPLASTSACGLFSSSTSSSFKNDAKDKGCVEIEYPIKIEPVSIISEHFNSEPEASTFACGLFSSSFKNDAKNEDILAVLKELNTRLEKLEQNQTFILQNQKVSAKYLADIVSHQQQIANKMEKIEAKMEGRVTIERETIRRMTDKTYDKQMDEVASMLPLQTLAAVREVEQKLDSVEFAEAMIAYLHKLKGTSEDVSSVIRAIFTDDLLEKFNWEGRWEKQALGKLMLLNKTLRDVFQQQGIFDYEKSVRKAIERSHHRMKQKKYIKKEK